ncbi:hypothetical protein FHL15_005556 [Xylaria flabelliformis]|uniref:Heterokaryon incompatibility domain-containing protein n=1 Tax=Xylaria flabelliformis TaxID=2512241 RepID=A0A553I053_9PEZI|nr:hypothetical protein FHL15_005556 [Xylaria flabelliformis]
MSAAEYYGTSGGGGGGGSYPPRQSQSPYPSQPQYAPSPSHSPYPPQQQQQQQPYGGSPYPSYAPPPQQSQGHLSPYPYPQQPQYARPGSAHSDAPPYPGSVSGSASPLPRPHSADPYAAQQQQYDRDPNGGGAEDGERGLGATLLGGGAGGFLGHKLGKGKFGTLLGSAVGAVAANVIENKLEGRNGKNKHHHGSSSHHQGGGNPYGYSSGGHGSGGLLGSASGFLGGGHNRRSSHDSSGSYYGGGGSSSSEHAIMGITDTMGTKSGTEESQMRYAGCGFTGSGAAFRAGLETFLLLLFISFIGNILHRFVTSDPNSAMRLLSRDDTGLFSLEEYLSSATIPPYAILSHTWSPDEVTYEDLTSRTYLHKHGYRKIRFCAEQAERDRLRHFWVDTCCIDKSSSAELSESINSMFGWYRNASKCYAYLEDVSGPIPRDRDQDNSRNWRLQFQRSRWFTRAWTLQELIAPAIVEFFSGTGEKLGNKATLESLICDVTGIPAQALRGRLLHHYTTTEKMAWAGLREATKPEDMAYSLLGIFDVQLPLIYGEGKEKAKKRLREEICKDQKGSQHEEFSVPFSLYDVPEIEKFVARENELAEIHEELRSDGSRRAVVLHGLGGIGKTQLAIAYTKRHKDHYSAIFWINISDENSLSKSFTRIANQIIQRHPSAKPSINMSNKGSPHETIAGVKEWLSLPNNTRWLLVYDNYDNPKLPSNTDRTAIDIQEYLPEVYQGSIMITTRSSEVKIGHTIRMGKIQNVQDSLEILSTTSKRKGLSGDHDAARLAEELDGLPLALATAGAYLEQTSVSFGSYLNLYRDSWVRLQTNTPQLGSYADRTLYSTWELSYNKIRQRNENAAALLRLWAYFNSQDIWLELLQSDDKHNIRWIREVTKDELTFTQAVRTLIDYGLVEIHYSKDERSIERRLFQHAAKYDAVILDTIIDKQAWIFSNLSILYLKHGKPKEAVEMCRRALTVCEKVFGSQHPVTLQTLNNLGIVYIQDGNFEKALEIYQRALQGAEHTLGPNHDLTRVIVCNLGFMFSQQGLLKDAEDIFQRTLQSRENRAGNIDTANEMYSLGLIFEKQGRLNEAENMYQRALKCLEEALGPNQISRVDNVYSPDRIFYDQSKLKDAEDLYIWGIIDRKRMVMVNVSILDIVRRLCSVFRAQGKLEEAEDLYYRALQGKARGVGPMNAVTLDIVSHLGHLLLVQGKLKDAEELYRWTLQGIGKHLGPNHLSTFFPVYGLGDVFYARGKPEEAEEMYRLALQGFQSVYGSDHIWTQYILRKIQGLTASRGFGMRRESPSVQAMFLTFRERTHIVMKFHIEPSLFQNSGPNYPKE